MDLRIKGHAAIVQGGSKGIGRGIAEALAAEGVSLLLAARGTEALEQAKSEIAAQHGVRVETMPADSADISAQPRLVEAAREAFGRLDIVVLNSGGPKPGTFAALDDADWRAAADLLVGGPVALLRAAHPLLAQSPAGRAFFVTSVSTRQPVDGLLLSNAFRPGVAGLVKALSQEWAADGIRLHSLAPGLTDTERLAGLAKRRADAAGATVEEALAAMRAPIPSGRLGVPADIGALAAFLSSPAADYLTGGNWLVDGGLVRAV